MNSMESRKKNWMSEAHVIEKKTYSCTREDFNKRFHEFYAFLTVGHLEHIMFTGTDCRKCRIVEYKGGEKVELICDSFTEINISNIKTVLSVHHFFNLLEFVFMDENETVISKKPSGYIPVEINEELQLMPKM